jgi:hypothetical protein
MLPLNSSAISSPPSTPKATLTMDPLAFDALRIESLMAEISVSGDKNVALISTKLTRIAIDYMKYLRADSQAQPLVENDALLSEDRTAQRFIELIDQDGNWDLVQRLIPEYNRPLRYGCPCMGGQEANSVTVPTKWRRCHHGCVKWSAVWRIGSRRPWSFPPAITVGSRWKRDSRSGHFRGRSRCFAPPSKTWRNSIRRK